MYYALCVMQKFAGIIIYYITADIFLRSDATNDSDLTFYRYIDTELAKS